MPAHASLQRNAPATTRTPTLRGTTAGSGAGAAPGSGSASAAAPAPLASSESKAHAGDKSPLRGRVRASQVFWGCLHLWTARGLVPRATAASRLRLSRSSAPSLQLLL
ncbi:hypothetical protein GQ54DRAFT_314366 [Martensiomyces pterosporus]|nr:hypothetical protein GQ54DRAFT_314366 [Martensiomyces pterosporus]